MCSFVMHLQHVEHGDAGPSGDNRRHQHHHGQHSDSEEDRPHMPQLQMHSQYVRSVFADEDEYRLLSSDDISREQDNTGCEQWPSQLQLAIAVDVPVQDELQHIAPERYNYTVPIQISQDVTERSVRKKAHARALKRSRQQQHREDAQHVQFGAALNDTEFLMSGEIVVPLFRLGQRQPCTNCGALLFAHEKNWGRLCCIKGQVLLPAVQEQLSLCPTFLAKICACRTIY